MSEAAAPLRGADEPTPPTVSRSRGRILVVLAAALVWCLAWVGTATGADRTGAAGAVPLALAWGLAAVLLLARRRRDLLVGEAIVAFAVAGLVTILVAARHPWIPGPDRRSVLVPIFGPLAILAVLDLATRARGAAVGIEVAVVRVAAATVAAVALFVAGERIPSGAALLLALLPAAAAIPMRARAARRALEAASLVFAVAYFLAPEIRAAVAPLPASAAAPSVAAFLHRLTGIGLGVIAAIGISSPEDVAPGPAAS